MDLVRGRRGTLLVLGAVLLIGAPAAFSHQASFQGLGDLPGGSFQGYAIGVSADGQAVVGHSLSELGDEAFLWTVAGGLIGLGDLRGGAFNSFSTMASNGGTIVVGSGEAQFGHRPFRWTAATGMVVLGDLPGGGSNGFATGMSSDGQVISGQSTSFFGTEAFRWTAATGMAGLGDLPGGSFGSAAWGVSADGIAVFGNGTNASNRPEAFVWTAAGGMVGLGFLPGGGLFSSAHGASDGGQFVVGSSDSLQSGLQDGEAFRWSVAGGMVGLGDLPGGSFNSFANGVSADGQIVVGGSETAAGIVAMLWAPQLGMVNLKELLLARGVAGVAGWTLENAHGISTDGATIIGYGINPSGYREPWIARLPRCDEGFADCDGVSENGCETPIDLPGNSVTGPPILNCGSCYEACDDGPQGACTTDLCVPTGGGRATCRHFDRARCAEARCQGTLFPGTDATCQGPDIDEDGLADAWEISQIQPYTLESQPAGIDIDCDGLLDEATDLVWPSDQLPEVGKKDVYLQIDFMAPSAELGETESHEPDSLAIRNVVSAFASAGIALHVDPVHRSVPHRNVVYLGPDPEGEPLACRGPAEETMDLYDIKRGSFDPKRTLAYHYALFGHFSSCDSPEDCAACPSDPDGHTPSFLSAGKAEQIGNDLIVSLGGFAFIEDSNSQETKARWEAGTLLHQLGHSLGLEHGGEEKVDFKPNYLSSMNSRYQLAGIPSAELPGSVMMVEARADLSRKALGPLDENALDEGAGLVLPTLISYHARDIASYECPEARSGAAAGAIDWNCNGVEGELLVPPTAPLDLNRDERLEILDGFGDWSHLKLAFQCEGNLAEAVPGDRRVVGELDFATAFQAHLLYAMAHPRLQIRGGTDSSFILLGSPAGVPVTLFGSTEFDVGKIVPSSVRLAGAVPISREIVDKDGDGHLDLLATFRQSSLRISSESRSVALTGYLTSSQAFEAIHAIQIRANPGKSKGAGLRNGGRPACPEPSGACP